jgi:hypothetical protein
MGLMKRFLKTDKYGPAISGGSNSGNSAGGGWVKFSVDQSAIELNVKHIESMMTDNPEMRQRLQEVIKKDVWQARQAVVRNIGTVFDNGDPAMARRAVRNVVYQKVLGANLNIFNMRRGTVSWRVRPVDRKGTSDPKGRGGNRTKRSFKTIRMHGYEGKARGMILRWVKEGNKADRTTRYGNRGSITARNFFGPLAGSAIDVVSQHLAKMIEEEIAKAFNEDNNS